MMESMESTVSDSDNTPLASKVQSTTEILCSIVGNLEDYANYATSGAALAEYFHLQASPLTVPWQGLTNVGLAQVSDSTIQAVAALYAYSNASLTQ